MTVDQMRWIDRNVGIPLCFLLTIAVKTMDFVLGRKRNFDVKKVLFIELSEMGSALLVDPAMRKLQREHHTELFFVIFKNNAKSLKILNTVPEENIFRMRDDGMVALTIDVIRFMFWTRKHRIKTVIDLELFSRFTSLLNGLSGAATRVGFVNLHDEGLYRGAIVNARVRYNPHVHISVNFMALVNTALGLHSTPYATYPVKKEELVLAVAPVNQTEQQTVMSKIKALYPNYQGERLVLLNANASDLLPQRRWLPDRFAAIGTSLIERYDDVLIVLTGAPAEHEYVEGVNKAIDHERCVNSAGYFAFEELIPLYQQSTLMLTNDSGPAHFASVTPLKVFVIFGPESPALYLPLGGNAEPIFLGLPCSPCVSAANHRKTTCVERPCISGITVEEVRQKLTAFLDHQPQVEKPVPASTT